MTVKNQKNNTGFVSKPGDNYLQQALYAEKAMDQIVEKILEQNPEAVVIGDEIIITRNPE